MLPVCVFQLTDGVVDVIMYPSSTDKSKNRGFAFVEYKSHKAAAMARRKLIPGTSLSSDSVRGSIVFCPSALGFFFHFHVCKLWSWLYHRYFSAVGPVHPSGLGPAREGRGRRSNAAGQSPLCESVDDGINDTTWSDNRQRRVFSFHEANAHATVAIILIHSWGSHDILSAPQVRNLMLNTSEETLFKAFSHFKPGSVERVKKFTDYAFVHYYCREDALAALDAMNGVLIDGAAVEVMLAKPAISKEDSSGSRRHGSRGYLKSNSNTAGGGKYLTYRGNGAVIGGASEEDVPLRTMAVSSYMGSPVFTTAAGEGLVATLSEWFNSSDTFSHCRDQALDNKDLNEGGPTHTNYCLVLPGDRDGHFFPLFPGTPLSHTSVLALKPSQFSTAVSLLDVYCRQNNWLEPEYHLYSTPGLDTTLLLLYKVHNYLQLYTIVTLELQYSQGLMWLCVCAWCVFSGGDLINTQHLHAR